MAKILLINPPIENRVKSSVSPFIDSFSEDTPMPPLGLMYLGAFLKEYDHEVEICDMAIGDYLSKYLMEWRVSKLPDFVGITSTTLTFYDALEVAKSIKAYHSGIKVVMGGANCSIYPEEVATHPEIDYIVQGEGELPFLDIINGDAPRIIKPKLAPMKDLPLLPDYNLVDMELYHSPLSKKPVYSLVTSRFCPYHCKFCYQPEHGKEWRALSTDELVSIFLDSFRDMDIEVEIYDDTFTYDMDRVKKFCLHLIKAKNDGIELPVWNIRTRVDKVYDELLGLMKKAGCQRINYGIESFDNEVLRTLGKGFRDIDARGAILVTKRHGIEVQTYFMLGSPNETHKQIMDTISVTNLLNPDYAYYSITSPMPATPLYEQGLREGRYGDYWREHILHPKKDMKMGFWDEDNREEIIEYMEYAYRSFYMRPSYILRQLLKVRSFKEFQRKSEMAIRLVK